MFRKDLRFTALLWLGWAVPPAQAIYIESQSYLTVPDAAHPLDELLPQKGVESTGGHGLLQVNSTYLKRRHEVNFETRQVEIIRYVSLPPPEAEPGSQDSTPLWQAYYVELNSYTMDMNDLALRRLWLNEFMGKEDAAQASGPGMLDIVLPVNVPDWMKRIGVDKPRLRINGSYKLVVEGTGVQGNGAPNGTGSFLPNLHMDQQPAFSVKGSIGRLINIEINNEEGFGSNLKEQLKITYKGEGDELEDDIIQEIEAGNTSLALTGTSLTGYTEAHKGLFGLKMRMKFGGLEVTTIASQEGGSQERQKLGVGSVLSDAVREDRDIDLHRHFWLKLTDRDDYGSISNWQGANPRYLQDGAGRMPVQVFQFLGQGEEINTVKDTATACPYNRQGGAIKERCEIGRWKPLKEGVDFFYDERMRMLTVPGGTRQTSLAVRWNGDFLGTADNRSLILIHSRSAVGVPDLDDLMWRNVYGISRIAKTDKQSFRVRLVRDADSLERDPNDTTTLIRKLGMERPDKPGQVNVDDPTLFNLDLGYMVLPCVGGISPTDDSANCLTPMKRVNKSTEIYTANVDEIANGPTVNKFIITAQQRQSTFDVRSTSQSVSGSQCVDIEKGTEKLVLNHSITLQPNIDYEVLYETGQITLLSPRAKDPNADIDISYECNPPFQIQDKILLGTRLEYKLDGISDESLLGATLLYKSQSTTAARPELGREPFNQLLWGFNARLTGNPKWMTRAANLFPFVQTEAPSRANFEFEVAQSLYNPNTKESAYLDNFEGSENILPMPMTIYSWTEASPPEFDDNSRPDETLDYRHQGQLIWHSSLKKPYAEIYGKTGSSYTDSRDQTLLQMTLTPNDNLEGHSWGGVMHGLGQGLLNQNKKRTLEVVVSGREGSLIVDMGQVSEDIAIQSMNNGKPNGRLDQEIDPTRETVNSRDYGLDNLPDAAEHGVRWECKPLCYSIPIESNTRSDPGGDNYIDPTSGATEEPPGVDGTQGNNARTNGLTFDTEDLDRSGTLDTKNTYLRYVMPLDSACSAKFHCEELSTGWRKYDIPLYGGGFRIGANSGESENQILSSVKIMRMWMGRLPSRVTSSRILLARVNLVGNTWEEGNRNTAFETDADRYASGDLHDSSAIRVPPAVTDSNRLKVAVINKQESRGYIQSPNTPTERDTRTDEPLPERSLVLQYENLHPGEVVGATRLLGSDPKDLTMYSRIRMDIHPDSNYIPGFNNYGGGQNKLSLGLRLGKDEGDRDSKDYYEIRIHMDTAGAYDKKQVALWDRNSFNVNISDLVGLKNNPLYQAFNGRPVSAQVWNAGRQDSSITLSVVGNPTLSRVDWMRLVLYVDSGATSKQAGEIWVDDLRLEGVDHSVGSSMRTQLQLEFSDFINVSGNLTYRNGGFTTMSETKATPANSQTTVDYNTNLSVFANKVFPDQWGISLPLTMSYHGAISRPFTRPASDLTLQGTDLIDLARDIADRHVSVRDSADSVDDVARRYARVYQSTVFEDRFTAAYKKEHRSSSYANQILFERPSLEYSYSSSSKDEFFASSQSRNYNTRLMYSLSPFENKTRKPLDFTSKWALMPSFLSGVEFEPYPDKLNLTLADLSFVRTENVNKPRNQEDQPLVIPPQYTVELTHGVDMEWRLLTFLNFGVRTSVDRDFDNEHGCFDETMWGQDDEPCGSAGQGGLLANNLVFDLDDASRHPGHLGDQYGILYRERNRTQAFHMDFNPNLFSWLTTSANFNSGFHQTRSDSVKSKYSDSVSSPEHFTTDADHDVKLNASLSLPGLLGPSDGKGLLGILRKKMDTWNLRNIDLGYTVGHKYNHEEYTYGYLDQIMRKDPWSYYAYQFGLMYDNPAEFFTTLFNGEPNPRWMDYLMAPDASILDGTQFSHGVTRSVDGSTGFTVPWVDLAMSFNLRYTQEYTLFRALTPSDTSVVWPDLTVTGSLGDFANKIPALRKTFRSMTSTTTFNLRKEDKHSLFSSAPETEQITYKLDPLVRVAATTNKDVRGELSLKASLVNAIDYEKVPDPDALNHQRLYRYYTGDTLQTAYVRTSGKETKRDAFDMGGDGSVAYDIQTQKGIQFWRYYVKLENNLRLKVSGSADYMWTERTLPDTPPHKDQNVLTLSGRPEASYNFTNNVDALFYIQYKYTKLYHTAREESTHEVTVHGEFTMRF